jgi:1-acyl-sn-glycerol-3-phosphate acyltransferase
MRGSSAPFCRRIVPASSRRDETLLRLARRLVTVPAYLASTLLLTLLVPILAPLCWVVSLRREWRGALRSGAFVLAYLWCESIGIAASAGLWLRERAPTRDSERWQRFLDANYALQCWWANALKASAERLFDLHFVLSGVKALDGPPAIMLPRHASIADTIIPMVFYATPKSIRLRYVLKRELLLDPCLDIVGNRLPNCFVARIGSDADADVERVAALARGRAANEGFLIYPEGTRFSRERQQRALASLASRVAPRELARMRTWTELLPPRPGGTCALITGAPDLDLVFCAHTGFEGASHFASLFNGSWIGAEIRVHFWRVPRAQVPVDAAGQRALLFEQWDRMQATVVSLQRDHTKLG